MPTMHTEAIATRRTVGRLVEPAPNADALGRAFSAAMAAPDHKRLRPWRFLMIEPSPAERWRVSEQLSAGDRAALARILSAHP